MYDDMTNEQLQQQIGYMQMELGRRLLGLPTQWMSWPCNCGDHKHGQETAGWTCPRHGRQM